MKSILWKYHAPVTIVLAVAIVHQPLAALLAALAAAAIIAKED